MAITEWTSEGMAWNSADDLRMGNLLPRIEAVRKATLERREVEEASYFFMGGLENEINRLEEVYPAMLVIEENIDQMINEFDSRGFLNHTEYNTWLGGSTRFTRWTEEKILDNTTIPTRVRVSRQMVVRDWMFQQYEILNLLRWLTTTSVMLPGGTGGFGREVEAQPTYSGAISALLAQPFAQIGGGAGYRNSFDDPTDYDIFDGRYAGAVYDNSIGSVEYSMLIHGLPGEPVNLTYYAMKGLAEGVQNILGETSEGKGNPNEDGTGLTYIIPELTDGDISSVPSPPSGDEVGYGIGYGNNTYIFKFDGANGFKFRDW